MKVVEYLAFILIGLSALALIGYFARGFFSSPEISLGIRIVCGVAAVGLVLLLGYVGWDRYHSARKEPQDIKEVKH